MQVHELFSGHGVNTTKLENDLLCAYDKMYNKLWTDTVIAVYSFTTSSVYSDRVVSVGFLE